MLYLNKRGIPGIPYFGLENNEVIQEILSAEIADEKEYDSLYNLVQVEKSVDKVVLVEYEGKTWLTYLRDIKFNYRDGFVFVPFYTFDVQIIDVLNREHFKGHLISIDAGLRVGVRYNYCLREERLTLENNFLVLYDVTLKKKYRVSFKKYYSSDTFDMDELYERYISYSKNYENNLIYKHTEGYHIISRNVDGMKNYERVFRKELGLEDYLPSNVNLYYRDVRNLSEADFDVKIGLDMSDKPYWERRYDFESMLFCVIWGNAIPSNEFAEQWRQLGKNKQFIKYGDKVLKLIIKSYWFPNCKDFVRKSWSFV